MNKELKEVFAFFGVFIAVVIIAFFIFSGDGNITGNVISEFENITNQEESIGDSFSNVKEYHFSQTPITYFMEVDSGGSSQGDEYEEERIRWALEIIENSTDGLIKFQEIDDYGTADLIISGFPPMENESSDTWVTEGLAGPIEVTENKIIYSEADFYASDWELYGGTTDTFVKDGWIWERTEYESREVVGWARSDCENFPNTEIHEILHALGIGHNYDNSYSIMFPIRHEIQSCKTTEIDKEIVSCLKYIYSNGELEEDCSNINMYPWPEEEEEIKDFKWGGLPITYSVSNCNERQKLNVQKAEKVIEDYIGYDLYKYSELGSEKINFRCHDSFEDVLLNEETDFWDTTVYFPSAQPYYNLDENGNVDNLEVLLFAQDRKCGGIEVHELLHGLGLRKHYGPWMEYETELCDTRNMVLSSETKDKIIELYDLEQYLSA